MLAVNGEECRIIFIDHPHGEIKVWNRLDRKGVKEDQNITKYRKTAENMTCYTAWFITCGTI